MKILFISLFLVITYISSTYAACGTAVLCEDFDSMADGPPSGAWEPNYPNCKGTGSATIDSTMAHTGKKSLRVDGAAGYCNHIFVKPTKNLTSVGKVWFVRMYLRHKNPLTASHVAFIAMHDSADGNKDLRIGGQNKALQWNRESDDATLPEQSPNGVAMSTPLPTDKWICFEYMVNGNTGEAQTWLDGVEVAGLHAGQKKADVDRQWSTKNWRPSLTDLRLGWESYGEGADTFWYDDVALGSSRIGCK